MDKDKTGIDEQVAQLEKAAEKDPYSIKSWYNLGELYCNLKRQDKVKEVYGKLGKLDEDLAEEFSTEVMRR